MAWLEEEQGSGANRNKELKALIVAALKNKGGAKTGNGNTAPVAINDDSILNALRKYSPDIRSIMDAALDEALRIPHDDPKILRDRTQRHSRSCAAGGCFL
jgi:hypothetical protein